jgi:hypothetical protein
LLSDEFESRATLRNKSNQWTNENKNSERKYEKAGTSVGFRFSNTLASPVHPSLQAFHVIIYHLSNRRRKRPRRYSEDFVDAAAYDVDANFESDDDIVGEVVYDDEYLKTRKSKSASSGSEGDEEYKLDDEEEDEENPEEEEYVEEEEDSIGSSEEELEMSHQSRHYKKESLRPKRGARKLRAVDEIETGLRRSKRSTRPKINYRKYELSESDTNSDADADVAYSENDQEVSTSSQDRNKEAGEEMEDDDDYENNYNNGENHNNYNNGGNEVMNEEYADILAQEQKQESLDKERSPGEEKDSLPRRFLDLNDPAPDIGFDDGPSMSVKDEDMDDS